MFVATVFFKKSRNKRFVSKKNRNFSIHKRFLKRNLADVGMNQLHWLTKYTNRKYHTVICIP